MYTCCCTLPYINPDACKYCSNNPYKDGDFEYTPLANTFNIEDLKRFETVEEFLEFIKEFTEKTKNT